MGTYASLLTGRLTLDSQKFGDFGVLLPDYSPLFQRNDERLIETEIGDETLSLPVIEKKLAHVVDRLELLGYTWPWFTRRIDDLVSLCIDERGETPPGVNTDAVIEALTEINANDERVAREDHLEYYIWYVLEAHLSERLHLDPDERFFRPLAERLGAFSTLRALAANPMNEALIVMWDIGDGAYSEYIEPGDLPVALDQKQQFLIVMEGTSDALVIKHALSLRKPHLLDFFNFVDVGGSYPFGGTGGLHNFCKGLAAIRVLNRTIAIYDNDAAGIAKYRETKDTVTLKNLSVEHLPTLSDATVEAIGPTGATLADANASAASIEFYLDLTRLPRAPLVRWTNYVESVDRYQGALVGKNDYVEDFLSVTHADAYDFTKLDLCLDSILNAAKAMAELLFPPDDASFADYSF